MIRESVAYVKSKGREVIYDAEHFFDGYKYNPDYARQTIETALAAGADMIVLCDTNGGTLPREIQAYTEAMALLATKGRLGIHVHNDGGLAVANSLAAVAAGARMVQGTVNGLGERCGNADLIPHHRQMQLKMGRACIPENQ
jgi:2-isopropylmalate synthase